MSNIIDNIRKDIITRNGNEVKAIAESISLFDVFERRQTLLNKINIACIEAVKETKQKYQAELDDIDREYAMLLMLTCDNKA